MFDVGEYVQLEQYRKYREDYVYSRERNHKKPIDVMLELASHCNMNCSYCYHADQEHLPFKKGFMSWELAESILHQCANLGVNSLKFNYRGESTTNPIFPKVTSLAKELAQGSTFIDRITNSNFKFNPDKEDIFRGLCDQTKVKVSYDSFRKSVFETQRTGGDHDITTRNIDKFYNYPKRDNILVIQAVRTTLNKDEDIEGLAKKRWPSAKISIRDMVAGRVDKDVSSMEHKTRDASERHPCIQAFARLVVTWDGKCLPCCPSISEDIVLGNANRQKMVDVFNGYQARILRESLKNKKAFDMFKSCKNCSSFESYKGYQPPWDS